MCHNITRMTTQTNTVLKNISVQVDEINKLMSQLYADLGDQRKIATHLRWLMMSDADYDTDDMLGFQNLTDAISDLQCDISDILERIDKD